MKGKARVLRPGLQETSLAFPAVHEHTCAIIVPILQMEKSMLSGRDRARLLYPGWAGLTAKPVFCVLSHAAS